MAPLVSALNKTFGAVKWIQQIDYRTLSCSAHDAPVMIKCTAMSTASARPQLQIRQAKEDDASPLCEIFNEAVQDHLETFDSEPRSVDDQRLRIAAAEQDPKHPILVAELRNWVAGWAALEPYDRPHRAGRYRRGLYLRAAGVPQLRGRPPVDARPPGSRRQARVPESSSGASWRRIRMD